MTLAALALVLGSAAVHALWNALLADADDTYGTTAVMLVAGVVLFAPVAALTWDVDGEAIPYVLGSGALELVYFALLATAYARADLTFVYPVARGSAPVIVLVVSVAALGAAVSGLQAGGVLVVAAGVLLVRGLARGRGADLALALAVGACIAGYTLVDDHGLEHADPIPYLALVLLVAAIPYAAVVGPSPMRAALSPRAVLAGAGMFLAYVLALAALQRAEAAPVAALRETSVVMAAVGAAVWGRARVPAARMLGAALVVAGAAAIALG
ncbi:MAG TPA: EamA family transporter [Solirubrobacteraceae bacterium]|nr:EamA family transporter [Solirubrobacteraceae bacterium]